MAAVYRSLNIIGVCLFGAVVLVGCASGPPAHARHAIAASTPRPVSPDTDAAIRQVIGVEQAFAKTMADRDFTSFVKFLSPDAVFFSGSEVSRGAAAIAAKWEPYFSGRAAPFTWKPDHVEVLASGDLALSTGPVFQDNTVVGRFSSIWRLESPNSWRIVFDKGEAVCAITP